MTSVSTTLVELLQFLLPGFLTAWVFYGFTPFDKPSQFERVVQALLFTIFVQALLYTSKLLSFLIGDVFGAFGPWIKEFDLLVSLAYAFLLGLLAAYLANSDKLHRYMRERNISGETSFASEWFRAFAEHGETYLLIELHDERRMLGWVREWPSRPKQGFLCLEDVSWVDENGALIHQAGVKEILVPVESVAMVSFMDGEEGGLKREPE